MFCLLGHECGSQRRVIDALRAEDVQKVPMEALNFAEDPRIAPCEMLPQLEHKLEFRLITSQILNSKGRAGGGKLEAGVGIEPA